MATNVSINAVPEHRVVKISYNGPKSGLGQGLRNLNAWVGTYFKDRMSDVVVCFDERPTPQTMGDRSASIVAEGRFHIDESISDHTQFPEGLKIKRIPSETLISLTYTGPITEMMKTAGPWMGKMAQEHDLRPGFRQRMVKTCKTPQDPTWKVEIQLVKR